MNLKNSIEKCDVDVRESLYSNIVLSGGTTNFTGFKERLEKELNNLLFPNSAQIKIINNLDPNYSAWIGASNLASLPSGKYYFIEKDRYREFGASVII